MEEAHKQRIEKNLVYLIQNTECNTLLLAKLRQAKVIGRTDQENLELSTLTQMEKAKRLYEILLTRTHSFEHLIEGLKETNQSGAVAVLTNPLSDCHNYGLISISQDDLIGTGSFGTKVYRGRFDGREVAVKSINIRGLTQRYARNEVDNLKKLDSHKNIIRYYWAEADENFLHIALELCLITLHDDIKVKLLNFPIFSILRKVTQGVAHLHRLKIVHGDIKPQDILLNRPNIVKLSDFGISKTIPIDASGASLTEAMGTAEWMAPEILDFVFLENSEGQKIRMTTASDIFSLECVFFFVMTAGKHVFGKSGDIVYNIRRYKLQVFETNLPKEWLALVGSMTCQDPEDRMTMEKVQSTHFLKKDECRSRDNIRLSDVEELRNPKANPGKVFECEASLMAMDDLSPGILSNKRDLLNSTLTMYDTEIIEATKSIDVLSSNEFKETNNDIVNKRLLQFDENERATVSLILQTRLGYIDELLNQQAQNKQPANRNVGTIGIYINYDCVRVEVSTKSVENTELPFGPHWPRDTSRTTTKFVSEFPPTVAWSKNELLYGDNLNPNDAKNPQNHILNLICDNIVSQKYAEDTITAFFKTIKTQVELQEQENIFKILLILPSFLGIENKHFLRKCGMEAGFQKITILPETAAFAYSFCNKKGEVLKPYVLVVNSTEETLRLEMFRVEKEGVCMVAVANANWPAPPKRQALYLEGSSEYPNRPKVYEDLWPFPKEHLRVLRSAYKSVLTQISSEERKLVQNFVLISEKRNWAFGLKWFFRSKAGLETLEWISSQSHFEEVFSQLGSSIKASKFVTSLAAVACLSLSRYEQFKDAMVKPLVPRFYKPPCRRPTVPSFHQALYPRNPFFRGNLRPREHGMLLFRPARPSSLATPCLRGSVRPLDHGSRFCESSGSMSRGSTIGRPSGYY